MMEKHLFLKPLLGRMMRSFFSLLMLCSTCPSAAMQLCHTLSLAYPQPYSSLLSCWLLYRRHLRRSLVSHMQPKMLSGSVIRLPLKSWCAKRRPSGLENFEGPTFLALGCCVPYAIILDIRASPEQPGSLLVPQASGHIHIPSNVRTSAHSISAHLSCSILGDLVFYLFLFL